MTALDLELSRRLASLRERGLERALTLPAGVDFASNDYLGLAGDPALLAGVRRRIEHADREGEAAFSPAARLLRGTTAAHLALERRLARFKGQEAALLFPSGYQANVGLLSALLGPADRAISDAQNHASIIDGLRLSGCTKVVVPHLDLAALAGALAVPHVGGRTVVVVESLYSMDGDLAPLGAIAALCGEAGADLVVDDAHATGLYGGERASGWVEAGGLETRVAAVVTTFGKALGVAGACVSGSRTLIDLLVISSRGFVFTTAQTPLWMWSIDAALDCLEADRGRARRARETAVSSSGIGPRHAGERRPDRPRRPGRQPARARRGGRGPGARLRRARRPPADRRPGHRAPAAVGARRPDGGGDRRAGRCGR